MSLVRRFFALSLSLLLSAIAPSFAGGAEMTIPAPPKIAAKAYILIDPNTGKILAEHEPDLRLAPASLTKILTAYTTFQELQSGRITLDSMVPISKQAWRTGGSKMFVKVNTEVSVEQLLHGLIIQSGNDAGVALAEFVAGSVDSFADLMNHTADTLGMKNSHFVNATGLPSENHYPSARDLAILTTALIKEFPEYYKYYSQLEYTYQPPGEKPITQPNRNRLLRRDKSVDGVKTGYTKDAGYCLVASAQRDGMRLISVVLGTETVAKRFSYSQSLLTWGFRFYESHRLYAAGQPVERVRVWKGDKERVDLGPEQDIYVTLPRGLYDKLDRTTEVNETQEAPIEKGATLGKVSVTLDGKPLLERPLVTLEAVPEGSLWRRMVDASLMMFE